MLHPAGQLSAALAAADAYAATPSPALYLAAVQLAGAAASVMHAGAPDLLAVQSALNALVMQVRTVYAIIMRYAMVDLIEELGWAPRVGVQAVFKWNLRRHRRGVL